MMKRIAVVFVIIAVFASLILTGCAGMFGSTGGTTAADGSTTGGDSSSSLMGFLPLILIIVVFYFILIRPQNKKNKQVKEMRDAIKRGDWVTTIGGMKGRIVRVKDDLITIEVGADKVKLEFMRWGISKVDESAPERKSSKSDKYDDDDSEKETPKRKPKKLAPVPKKEEEPEDEEEPDDADDVDDIEDDGTEDDEE